MVKSNVCYYWHFYFATLPPIEDQSDHNFNASVCKYFVVPPVLPSGCRSTTQRGCWLLKERFKGEHGRQKYMVRSEVIVKALLNL